MPSKHTKFFRLDFIAACLLLLGCLSVSSSAAMSPAYKSSLPLDYLAEITVGSNGEGYYAADQKWRLFNPYPKPDSKRPWRMRYFGPVGIGIDLRAPGMTMEIANVEEGSPADKTGRLKKGQVIETINGVRLKGIDPRIILGDIITQAEATDGKIVLDIRDLGEVTVQIPVMGKYSDTWPLNCPKSDKIVRNLADKLAEIDEPYWGSVFFLISTGEEKDLDVVRRWMKDRESIGSMNWEKGYKGPSLCEYYLRTGDQSVLPMIKRMTEELRENMYNGGWSGRGKPASYTYGHLSASGVHCLTFLIMAKMCGVEVDDYMFNQVFPKFYRHASHGNVPYGDNLPEHGYRDNGKTSGLALALGAAALLSPQGEQSIYAKARDNSAMKAFYATNWFHAAHTGGGMGEIWHHTAMNQMREKRPRQYRSYFDTRRWVMELSRRHDGSIAIAGMDDAYNRSATDCSAGRAWGTYFALTYTLPRKQLQLFGAPRSPWAKQEALPRPWGNEADDVFHSIEPIPGGPLTRDELLNETVINGSSVAALDALYDPDVSEETLLKYIHHPEFGLRVVAVRVLVDSGKYHLVLPLLQSGDARLREVGLLAVAGMDKGRPIPDAELSPAMLKEVSRMLMDPNEAWWVTYQAIRATGRADQDFIVRHRSRLLEILDKHESEFLQQAAVATLTKIATDPEHYQVVFPALVEKATNFRVYHASLLMFSGLRKALNDASPVIKRFAEPLLKETFVSLPPEFAEPRTGTLFQGGAKATRAMLTNLLAQVPEGGEFLKRVPKETTKSFLSGRESDQFVYDEFEMNGNIAGEWIWEHYGKHKYAPGDPGDQVDVMLKNYVEKKPFWRGKEKKLILRDNGQVESGTYRSKYYWSGDMLYSLVTGQALKMHYRVFNGIEMLAVEQPWEMNPVVKGHDKEKAESKGPEDFVFKYRLYFKRDEMGNPKPTTDLY